LEIAKVVLPVSNVADFAQALLRTVSSDDTEKLYSMYQQGVDNAAKAVEAEAPSYMFNTNKHYHGIVECLNWCLHKNDGGPSMASNGEWFGKGTPWKDRS
jgi:hypothetical protein